MFLDDRALHRIGSGDRVGCTDEDREPAVALTA
jgi:hypothetical protein